MHKMVQIGLEITLIFLFLFAVFGLADRQDQQGRLKNNGSA